MRAVISFFFLSLFSLNVFADEALNTYTYRVTLPQVSGYTCNVDAARLGDRFAQSTEFEVIKSECTGTTHMTDRGKSYPLSIIVVTYRAKSPAAPYTAVIDAEFYQPSADSFVTLYPTFEACVEDINDQWAAYRNNTGLVPVSYFCEQRAIAGYPANYRLKIEGFGKPKASIYNFHGYRDFDAAAKSQVKGLLQSLGATIVKEMDSEIFYYSATSLSVGKQSFAFFQDMNECVSQIPDATTVLQGLGATMAIVRCAVSQDKLYQGQITLEGVSNTNWVASNDFGYRSPTYFSFAECMQDKSRAVNEARGLGGICARDVGAAEERYKLNVFSKY
jgi:hypothetical protein